MKRITVFLMAGLMLSGVALADDVDDALSTSADSALKAHTRTMIQTGVPKDQGLEMTRAMIQNRFQKQQIMQAQEMVMETARRGLPAEPLVSKAQEGIAKGVAPERVLQAMAQVETRYAQAYRMTSQLNVGPQAKGQAGAMMAEAMASGMTKDAGERIVQEIQARTHTANQAEADHLAVQTAMTTREMSRLGVNADTTAKVLGQALRNRAEARDMAELRQQFRDHARSQGSQQLANQLANQLQQGQSIGGAFGQGGGSGFGGGSGSGGGSGGGGGGGGGGR